jgi:hypothetical protein
MRFRATGGGLECPQDRCPTDPLQFPGFIMIATCANPGTTSFKASSHLPPIEGSKKVNPVVLSPGRAKLAT